MKYYPIIAFVLLAFVQACGSETNTEPLTDEVQTLEEVIDTAIVEPLVEEKIVINDHLQAILDKSDTTYQLPINVDTNFVNAIDFEQKSIQTSLSFENGRYLGARLLENAPTGNATYNIEVFCKIDSLKSEGEYEDYVNNLDIGMMQVAEAFVEGLIEIDSSKLILLWSITFSTYEACPYASGSLVFGTLLHNYEVQNTMLLAEVSGGGDPPSWGETRISTSISKTLEMKTNSINQYGDSDEGEVETIAESYLTEIGVEAFEYGMDY
ncbi:MAG: hypothetical protein GQ574_04495 [Crocinitomix sp.]|nr:hypothetical protein [Crocinitomix sp.]